MRRSFDSGLRPTLRMPGVLLSLFLGLAFVACEGKISSGSGGGAGGGLSGSGGGSTGGGSGGGGETDGGSDAGGGGAPDAGDGGIGGPLTNLDVYTRLYGTCGGCHSITERPYFVNLAAFENSIAYDPRWVVPGSPQTSVFMSLLNGTRPVRMPPAPQDPFSVLAAKGQTLITIAEVEEWIRNLKPPVVVTPLNVAVVRRKTAEQVIRSLYDQLGLGDTDFYNATWDPKANDTYAVRSPDAMPYADPFDQGGTLFMAMGGPWRLEGKLRNDAPSQGFVQALTHVSQAWCRTAFNKAGNTAVLSKATLADVSTTTTGAANIRANISDLYLRMLGEDAPAAEVDDLFLNVFKPYESKGAVVAWTAVCASLVRDPLWMLY
jgi:hypothetical protein